MTTLDTTPATNATRAFSRWLQAGLALTLVFPTLRGFDADFGWWPMWLVALPMACLMLLQPRQISSLAMAGRRRWRARERSRRQAVRYRINR